MRQLDAGEVERVDRGVYQLVAHMPGQHHDMALVAVRHPQAVMVLSTALAYHRLTTDVPPAVMVAVPRNAYAPRPGSVPMDVVRMDIPIADIQETQIEGVLVQIQRPGAAVADAVRFPERVGRDVLIDAFLCAARRPGMLAEIRAAAERRRILHRVQDWLSMAAVRG